MPIRCVGTIEPVLQWGRGLSPTETFPVILCRSALHARFNGAAGFRPRRRDEFGLKQSAIARASMGPRAFAHGDSILTVNLIAANCASMGPRAFAHGDSTWFHQEAREAMASMGPRAFAHGDTFYRFRSYQSREASMGPRAFAHGDFEGKSYLPMRLRCFNGAAGFRPRRRAKSPCWRGNRVLLQWGRGLSPTETSKIPVLAGKQSFASMGPRAFAHGDHF